MSKEKQIRHERLIDFLNQFSQFQNENNIPVCKKVNEHIGPSDLAKLSINDINLGVVVLTDYFNLIGGSIGGGIDLYHLLQAYFLVPGKRKDINKVVEEALSSLYEQDKLNTK